MQTGAAAGNTQGQQTRGLEVIDSAGRQITSFSGSYALIIGESNYNNGWAKLDGVRNDTVEVKRLFEEQGFTVQVLEDADSSTLKSGIESFLNRYGYVDDNRLLIYYGGHGYTMPVLGREMGYIVPVNAPNPQKSGQARQEFQQMAIPMQQFDTWAKQFTCRHIMFMFDSCFSGSVFQLRDNAQAPILDARIARPVRQFISSGSANERVPDESVFRRQLVRALSDREADVDGDGYVSGTELGIFLTSTVHRYNSGRQTPQYGKVSDPNLDQGDFVFAVGRQAPVPPPVEPRIVTIDTPPEAEYNHRSRNRESYGNNGDSRNLTDIERVEQRDKPKRSGGKSKHGERLASGNVHGTHELCGEPERGAHGNGYCERHCNSSV
ncbi:hypothetical protein FACS1894200_06880 [Spirochaetia bacterium]|nr:hypothetical protein FACS1894200_06880 [Spirochaetia bacterium]